MMSRDFGIVPKEWEGKNFYRILEVSVTASQDAIKRAHRKLVRDFHPDVSELADRNEKFNQISESYSVLGDPYLRNLYDEYFLGEDYARPEREPRKRRGAFPLLIRAALFILIVLILRNLGVIGPLSSLELSGASSQATANSSTSRNPSQSDGSRNQILALIVGPKGDAGVAGVAGRDGFIGLNGYQGKDGLPGAPGPVGPAGAAGERGLDGAAGVAGAKGADGAAGPAGPAGPAGATGPAGAAGVAGSGTGVALEVLQPGDLHCANGGLRLTQGTGDIYYACNSSSSGSVSGVNGYFVASVFGVTNCDTDGVHVALESDYRSGDFFVTGIAISELSGLCNGAKLTTIIRIKASGTIFGNAGTYERNDVIQCSMTIVATPSSANNLLSVNSTNATCINKNATVGSPKNGFTLTDINARDVSDSDGGLALQISSS